MVAHPYSPELVSKQAIVRFATRAEELGFDGVGFTDHPAPSHRWLQAGGHDALDPFVAFGAGGRGDRAAAAHPEHPRAAVPQPVPGGQGGGHARRGVGRAVRPRRSRPAISRASTRRSASTSTSATPCSTRRSVVQGHLVDDDFAYDGLHFSARGQTANPKPAHPDLDRREQRPVAPAGGRRGRRVEPVRGPEDAGPDGEDARPRDGRRPAADARPPVAVRRRGGARPGRDRHLPAGARLPPRPATDGVRRAAAPRRAGLARRARRHVDQHLRSPATACPRRSTPSRSTPPRSSPPDTRRLKRQGAPRM